VRDYAKAIVDLADDADNRERMGKLGRVRVEEELAWPYSARAYLGVYERVAGPAKSGKA
jgi:glycosyltransferase involved in cell wall biosynthesis